MKDSIVKLASMPIASARNFMTGEPSLFIRAAVQSRKKSSSSANFSLVDGLQETRVYQDAKAEGKAEGVNEGVNEGRQAEGQSLILRQLSRRFGTLSPEVNTSVIALSLAKLEDLGEALLDFQEIIDLMNWLETNG
jgi:predicted transposase YdaD